jgi:hypothetical protein
MGCANFAQIATLTGTNVNDPGLAGVACYRPPRSRSPRSSHSFRQQAFSMTFTGLSPPAGPRVDRAERKLQGSKTDHFRGAKVIRIAQPRRTDSLTRRPETGGYVLPARRGCTIGGGAHANRPHLRLPASPSNLTGRLSRVRDVSHAGGSATFVRGVSRKTGLGVFEAPLPQSNARSMGRLYPARSHPAGVLLPGRSGAAILDREPPSTRSGVRPYARTCGRAFIDPDWVYGIAHFYPAFAYNSLKRITGDGVFRIYGNAYEPLIYGSVVLLGYWLFLFVLYRWKLFVRI